MPSLPSGSTRVAVIAYGLPATEADAAAPAEA